MYVLASDRQQVYFIWSLCKQYLFTQIIQWDSGTPHISYNFNNRFLPQHRAEGKELSSAKQSCDGKKRLSN